MLPGQPGARGLRPVPADGDLMVKNFQEPSSAGVIEIRPVTVRLMAPRSDPAADGLNYLPPPRPPRSLVRSA